MSFPSPVMDYAEKELSLDELCIPHKGSVFFMRADKSHIAAGIRKGAILVVNRSITPGDDAVVIAAPEQDFVLCQLKLYPRPMLYSLDGNMIIFDSGEPGTEEGLYIFGVVTHAVNKMSSES